MATEDALLRSEMKANQVHAFRGSKSRNKVSVGEPAEGSLLETTTGPMISVAKAMSVISLAV